MFVRAVLGNDIAERELKTFLGSEKKFFMAGYARWGKFKKSLYFGHINYKVLTWP